MDAENFFSRWSRRKAQARQEHQERAAEEIQATEGSTRQSVQNPSAQESPPPTMEDVAVLTPQSDFSRFLAEGVDPAVRRSAMKKMLSDPHFNVMDGLDIYIDDYNKFQPLPDTMLAALNHAQSVLNPQPLFDRTTEKLIDETGDSASMESAVPATEPASLSEGSERQAGHSTGPVTAPVTLSMASPVVLDSPGDDSTTAGTVQERPEEPERPEGVPDHGKQISRM